MFIFMFDLVLIIFMLLYLCYLYYKRMKHSEYKMNDKRMKHTKYRIHNKKIYKNGIKYKKVHFNEITKWAMNKPNNTVIRSLQKTSVDLDNINNDPRNIINFKCDKNEFVICYGCSKPTRTTHPDYVFSCVKCGNLFKKNRNLSVSQINKIALVIGGRTKLGHQVVLKLLRADAKVYVTTRYPEKAVEIYNQYYDYEKWKDNLVILKLDLDTNNMEENINIMLENIKEKVIDILVICAAQTIRCREKANKEISIDEKNRYNDPKYVNSTDINSWDMKITDFNQIEMEEVFRINAIGPALIFKNCIKYINNSKHIPYIINVHAKEGLITTTKSNKHIHTNMAKIALAMFTRGIIDSKFKTNMNMKYSIHGCDPGWISVDEYYEHNKPLDVPPLDEIDGASRILYPLFKNESSKRKTRRHFNYFCY